MRFIPIISIFLLFLVVFGGYFYWWPGYQHFQDLRAALAGKKGQLEQAEEYLLELKTLSNRLAEYEDELAKVDSALPDDPSIPALFNFIQKTSSENGLILKKIGLIKLSPEEISAKERIVKIPFSVVVSGSYPAFKNFLLAVYKNARIIKVDSIDFSSSPILEGKETGLFVFNLTLETQSF